MEVRDEERRKEEEWGTLEERVEIARRRTQYDQSEEARELFEKATTALGQKEHEEAERCRRRSKITWFKEGEAPSKYFFVRLKAKQAHEEMTALQDAAGRIVEERDEVLETVHKFYEHLYTAEIETEEMVENRRKVVERIDRRLTDEQNRLLEDTPSEELITRIKLIGKDSRGVIKLIPKNERKHLLQNWRPITLLTMTYKIIAKVVAIRLKEMLPGLIDTQQIGFVAGRNIIDNILSLRIGQEWAQVTDQDVIFVKLDFMKAYDRVAHNFLWDTLRAMGMGSETVGRIQGLVEGGKSEVHINGSFTEEFSIGRGVRQGCPLAPLLFAMTTQPLMRALREEERNGNIQGLNIGGGHSLLHQLFADDTGICITAEEEQFESLKEVIQEFESASGARLNLQKSVVMQLTPRQHPTWMDEAGCEIVGAGRSFKYLGVSTSSPIDEKTITEDIVQKLMRKLKHWSNRLLSWPAKTILLKHVLAATPVYQLMSVGLCKDGLEELERLCRNFLWGWNKEGNPKHSLIAWERIAQEKGKGGLGWTSFRKMADALNVRLVGRILEGGNTEWIQLARSFILRTLRKGSYQREHIQWTLAECLVLLPLTRVEGSPTLTRIMGSWYRARKRLGWNESTGELDGRLSMLQVKTLQQLAKGGGISSLVIGKELGLLRRMGITSLEEAMEVSRTRGWRQQLRDMGSFPEEGALASLAILEEWCSSQRIVRKNLIELEGWQWGSDRRPFKWWRPTSEWRQLLAKEVNFDEKMEEKWQRQSQRLR
ncbi:hypothetical protein R1sor_006386 [Riccia sorocarpa]|uniref:Reverse transcriptase domain-containing protein n=1 Tax=Riccia sorocarpa TaxID=122646 RepID=A0ABD3HRK9_9MARC